MQRDGCRDHNENDEETSESVIRTNFRLKREVGMLASELALKLSCSPDLYMIAREELVGLSLPLQNSILCDHRAYLENVLELKSSI